MAILYRPDGTYEALTPENGVFWTLEEKQKVVGGYIRYAQTRNGGYLVVDDEGIRKGYEPNLAATALYIHGEYDILRGNVLLIETRKELEEPEGEQEW